MKAIRNTVIVQKIQQESTTQSGIIIQGHDTEQQQRLRVVTVGESVDCVATGDVVVVDQATRGRQFVLDGQQYFVISDQEIVAVYQ